MNSLECYIKEIISVEDVTEQAEKSTGEQFSDNLLKVKLTYDCYGSEKTIERIFRESEFERAKECGFFIA